MRRGFFAARVSWLALVVLCCGSLSCRQQDPPRAYAGVVDLRDWNFEEDGIIDLRGAWEVSWQQLLSPSEIRTQDPQQRRYFVFPGFWNRHVVDGAELGANACATFRLKVLLSEHAHKLALRLEDMDTASRLWVDGIPVAQVGQVSCQRQNAIARYATRVRSFSPRSNSIDILLQVSNWHRSKGGPANRISLGRVEPVQLVQDWLEAIDLFLVGALFFMGFYHLLLFTLRRSDLSPLLLAGCCLCWGQRNLSIGLSGKLISKLWPDIPWDILLKSDLIGFYLGAALLLLFLHFLYPREGSKWVARFAFFAGVVASLFVLLTPSMIAGLSVPYYEIIVALYTPYGIWQLTRAVLRRRQGAALILVGFCLFAVAGVNDILHDLEIIQTASLTTVGVFVFLLFNTAMLSIRFSRAYVDVEKLSQSLESKNEELHRLDQLKDEFLAKTSHELRTPLHAINGLAESLLAGSAGALTPAMQQDLGLLSASAQRLSRLVNDILDAAKLKYSDLVLQPRAVNIHAVVAAVLEVLRGTIGQRALLLVNNVPKDLPMASADEDRLQQIFYNLVGNAIKHTDTGQICIEAREHGGMLEMSVTDSGSGIPQERLAQIFEPYEQLENAGKNKAGTGLGLSIVRQLIELQGGHIEVDSTYASGARFVFTLPYARELELKSFAQVKEYPSTTQRASAFESALLTPDTTRAAADDTRPSVLAIDDEAVNLRLLHHYLDEHYRLTTLGSGKEALRLLQSEPLPDLLLLDLMMPVTSGYDVCRTLRKSYDEAELPIVILTAKNSNDDLIAAFAAGANDYLNKPFGRDELLARVGAQLQTRAAVNSQRQLLLLQRKLDAHKASEMKSKLEAEQASLRMLRYQLNPHLIFNALASIRGAIVSEPQVARDMVTRLAEFCRLALQQGQRQTQTLADELLMVRNYIEIEKARLGEYLSFDAHIDVELEHLEVPALLLQPLVENAVKYGKLSNQQALRISVDVRRCNDSREDERVSLTVANTGHWIEQNSEKGFGIGRANLVARLQKQYTDRYDISVEESDGWVRVRLQLPLQPFAVVDVEKA